MSLHRRSLIQSMLAAAAASSGMIPVGQASAAEGTPATEDQASPVMSAPGSFEEVLDAYAERESALTDLGRQTVTAFLDRDDERFAALLAPAADEALGGVAASDLVDQLTTNWVSFSYTDAAAYFDVQFAGEQRMEGFFTQGSLSPLSLETDEKQSMRGPVGVWTGMIAGSIGISVTFSGTADALEATLAIPEQDLDVPLDGVRFDVSRPFGEQVAERALPIGSPNEHYAAQHMWGEQTMVILVVPDPEESGKIGAISVLPQYALPEDPAAGYTSEVDYRLPADGVWLTYWGGETEFQNYHATTPNQRHAFDLVVWRDGATFTGDGTSNEDFFAFGQPALAPADGRVVAVENGMPDMDPGEMPAPSDAEGEDAVHPAGNHVIIETAADEFVVVAHMQEGSVVVAEGDTVRAGDRIGTVGNSGNTSESHLHIHVQDTADFFSPDATGLPLTFANARINDEDKDAAVPVQGQFIASFHTR